MRVRTAIVLVAFFIGMLGVPGVAQQAGPETTIDSGPPSSTSSTSATFTFHSDDPGASFECSLDGFAFQPCSSGVTYQDLGVGSHIFQVRASGPNSGTDSSPATWNWTITSPQQSQPPETIIDAGPSANTTAREATFTFHSEPAGATFQCSLDGAPFTGCSSPQSYMDLGPGEHTFSVRATSTNGTDPTPAIVVWTIAESQVTYLVPHILGSKDQAITPGSFNSLLVATYVAGLGSAPPGPGATVNIYLYRNGGEVMDGTTGPVCNPCSYSLNGTNRKKVVNLHDLVVDNGGGFDTRVKNGFGIVTVTGDSRSVILERWATNNHDDAFDIDLDSGPLFAVPASHSGYHLPHVVESKGDTSTSVNSFDTSIQAVYAGGRAGVLDGGGASVSLFLYGNGGGLLRGATGVVCNPCTFSLTRDHPKRSISIDRLIRDAGGFDARIKVGYAVLTITGDAKYVVLERWTINTHRGPFELTFDSEPARALPSG